MVEPTSQIERVVLEVLSEMGLAPGTGSQAAGGAAPARGADGDLVLDRRVVSLAELPEKLDGVRRLVVPPGAVVTPSVRDLLNRNHVSLAFGASPLAPAAGSVRAIVIAVGPRYDPDPLLKALGGEGFAVDARRMDCLIAATDQLAAELRAGGTVGVLLTRHAAAAVCLANRLAGVRAVHATTLENLAADADAVGANLLVIDPGSQGFVPTRQMITSFVRGGVRPCPEVFRQRLG
jgi:hypothetical protein